MKKQFLFLLVSIFFFASHNGFAQETYEVTTQKLNVRRTPSTTGKVLGNLIGGETIEVESFSGNWACFKFNGMTAYVSSSYLKKCNLLNNPDTTQVTHINDTQKTSTISQTSDVVSSDVSTKQPISSKDNEYKSTNIGVLTGFHEGEHPIFSLSFEHSGYNTGYGEIGIRTTFRKDLPFAVHIGFGRSIGLYKETDKCISLVIPALIHLRLTNVSEYNTKNNTFKDKTKVFCDLSFTPKIQVKLKTLVLSAGYCMYASTFRFKKPYLGHMAIFSIGFTR